ncbi:MAG: acetyl-CoA carboxylase biotin carboxyl carrier protein [Rhodospirillales bacterium]
MALSYKEIAEIVKLIDASSCDEFVIDIDDLKLAIRRKSASGEQTPAHRDSRIRTQGPPAGEAPSPDAAATEDSTVSAGAAAAPRTGARTNGLVEVRSPMVGTFYRRPQPEADPFVDVGAEVKKGDPLCLVEVMKLFTTVYADEAGEIVEIAAEDGGLVEYDQVLFLVRPT